MKRTILATMITFFLVTPAVAADGLVDVPSTYTFEVTADRLVNILSTKGMTIFNRIKHSESAAKVGIELRKTELILFGNPKAGSPLMACQQSVSIDLPQKAVVWEDNNAKVWISYNDPRYLEKRHSISGCEEPISKIEKALAGIANAAATK